MQVKKLLILENSEPCASMIFSIFKPLQSDDQKYIIEMDSLELVQNYIEHADGLVYLSDRIALKHTENGFTKEGIEIQISSKINIISSIESYLIAHWDDSGSELKDSEIIELAKGTLAYFLANDSQRKQITELFRLLAENIRQKVTDPRRRNAFGKTMYGMRTSMQIENWVLTNIKDLRGCNGYEELLAVLWPVLSEHITNGPFRKCDHPDTLRNVATGWISGRPFYELLDSLTADNATMIAKTQRRKFKIEHIVDICENALSYEGTLAIGAVVQIIGLMPSEENTDIILTLQKMQKRLKYGLPSDISITLYELGFADRVISIELASFLGEEIHSKREVILEIRRRQSDVVELLNKYPSYFNERLKDILSG